MAIGTLPPVPQDLFDDYEEEERQRKQQEALDALNKRIQESAPEPEFPFTVPRPGPTPEPGAAAAENPVDSQAAYPFTVPRPATSLPTAGGEPLPLSPIPNAAPREPGQLPDLQPIPNAPLGFPEVSPTAPGAQTMPYTIPRPAGQTTAAEPTGARRTPVGQLVPDQLGDPELSHAEALAACGPAAAIAFARATGSNPTLSEAIKLAKQFGWTTRDGQAGPAAQQKLLTAMGVPTRLESTVNWDRVRADVSSGNPVTIDTPAHYFVATAYDPATGKYNFEKSGTVMGNYGGREWMTPEEVAKVSTPRAALYLDNPATPNRSPVVTTNPAKGDLVEYARSAAQRSGIDPDLFVRQIQQESGFRPDAGSPAGARGIAQIVPQYHPGVDVTDPYKSLDYAANLMATNVKTYGDYGVALAAYNAGPGAVQKYGGIPPFEETQRYVKTILGNTNPAPSSAPYTPGKKITTPGQGAVQGTYDTYQPPPMEPYTPSPVEQDYLSRTAPLVQQFEQRMGVKAPTPMTYTPYVPTQGYELPNTASAPPGPDTRRGTGYGVIGVQPTPPIGVVPPAAEETPPVEEATPSIVTPPGTIPAGQPGGPGWPTGDADQGIGLGPPDPFDFSARWNDYNRAPPPEPIPPGQPGGIGSATGDADRGIGLTEPPPANLPTQIIHGLGEFAGTVGRATDEAARAARGGAPAYGSPEYFEASRQASEYLRQHPEALQPDFSPGAILGSIARTLGTSPGNIGVNVPAEAVATGRILGEQLPGVKEWDVTRRDPVTQLTPLDVAEGIVNMLVPIPGLAGVKAELATQRAAEEFARARAAGATVNEARASATRVAEGVRAAEAARAAAAPGAPDVTVKPPQWAVAELARRGQADAVNMQGLGSLTEMAQKQAATSGRSVDDELRGLIDQLFPEGGVTGNFPEAPRVPPESAGGAAPWAGDSPSSIGSPFPSAPAGRPPINRPPEAMNRDARRAEILAGMGEPVPEPPTLPPIGDFPNAPLEPSRLSQQDLGLARQRALGLTAPEAPDFAGRVGAQYPEALPPPLRSSPINLSTYTTQDLLAHQDRLQAQIRESLRQGLPVPELPGLTVPQPGGPTGVLPSEINPRPALSALDAAQVEARETARRRQLALELEQVKAEIATRQAAAAPEVAAPTGNFPPAPELAAPPSALEQQLAGLREDLTRMEAALAEEKARLAAAPEVPPPAAPEAPAPRVESRAEKTAREFREYQEAKAAREAGQAPPETPAPPPAAPEVPPPVPEAAPPPVVEDPAIAKMRADLEAERAKNAQLKGEAPAAPQGIAPTTAQRMEREARAAGEVPLPPSEPPPKDFKIVRQYGNTTGRRFAAVEVNGERFDVPIRGTFDGQVPNAWGAAYPTQETKVGPIRAKALEQWRTKHAPEVDAWAAQTDQQIKEAATRQEAPPVGVVAPADVAPVGAVAPAPSTVPPMQTSDKQALKRMLYDEAKRRGYTDDEIIPESAGTFGERSELNRAADQIAEAYQAGTDDLQTEIERHIDDFFPEKHPMDRAPAGAPELTPEQRALALGEDVGHVPPKTPEIERPPLVPGQAEELAAMNTPEVRVSRYLDERVAEAERAYSNRPTDSNKLFMQELQRIKSELTIRGPEQYPQGIPGLVRDIEQLGTARIPRDIKDAAEEAAGVPARRSALPSEWTPEQRAEDLATKRAELERASRETKLYPESVGANKPETLIAPRTEVPVSDLQRVEQAVLDAGGARVNPREVNGPAFISPEGRIYMVLGSSEHAPFFKKVLTNLGEDLGSTTDANAFRAWEEKGWLRAGADDRTTYVQTAGPMTEAQIAAVRALDRAHPTNTFQWDSPTSHGTGIESWLPGKAGEARIKVEVPEVVPPHKSAAEAKAQEVVAAQTINGKVAEYKVERSANPTFQDRPWIASTRDPHAPGRGAGWEGFMPRRTSKEEALQDIVDHLHRSPEQETTIYSPNVEADLAAMGPTKPKPAVVTGEPTSAPLPRMYRDLADEEAAKEKPDPRVVSYYHKMADEEEAALATKRAKVEGEPEWRPAPRSPEERQSLEDSLNGIAKLTKFPPTSFTTEAGQVVNGLGKDGLMLVKVGPGRYNILHAESRTPVVRNLSNQQEGKVALWRMAQERDWTQPWVDIAKQVTPTETANYKLLGIDPYSDLQPHPPAPKPPSNVSQSLIPDYGRLPGERAPEDDLDAILGRIQDDLQQQMGRAPAGEDTPAMIDRLRRQSDAERLSDIERRAESYQLPEGETLWGRLDRLKNNRDLPPKLMEADEEYAVRNRAWQQQRRDEMGMLNVLIEKGRAAHPEDFPLQMGDRDLNNFGETPGAWGYGIQALQNPHVASTIYGGVAGGVSAASDEETRNPETIALRTAVGALGGLAGSKVSWKAIHELSHGQLGLTPGEQALLKKGKPPLPSQTPGIEGGARVEGGSAAKAKTWERAAEQTADPAQRAEFLRIAAMHHGDAMAAKPDAKQVQNAIAAGLHEVFVNSQARLEDAEEAVRKYWFAATGEEKLPDWLRASAMNRLDTVYPAMERINNGLTDAFGIAGPKHINDLKKLIEFNDNLDKARAVGRHAEQDVLGQEFKDHLNTPLAREIMDYERNDAIEKLRAAGKPVPRGLLTREFSSPLELQQALTDAKAEVRRLERGDVLGDPTREAARQDEISVANALRDRLQKRFDSIEEEWNAQLGERATAHGKEIAAAHLSPGGHTESSSQLALDAMQRRIDPADWDKLQEASRAIQENYIKPIRERLVEAGVYKREFADLLEREYPNYIPEVIADYEKDPSNFPSGHTIGLSDIGVRKLTPAGTAREREDVVESLVRMALEGERRAGKNETANAVLAWRFVDPDMAKLITEVPIGGKAEVGNGQKLIHAFEDGIHKTFVIDKALAPAFEYPTSHTNVTISGRTFPNPAVLAANVTRATATTYNPGFALIRNVALDAPAFFFDQARRYGAGDVAQAATTKNMDPLLRLPKLIGETYLGNLAEILKHPGTEYRPGDVFQGLTTNQFQGAFSQEYRRSGAAQFGVHGGTQLERAQLRKVVEQGGGYVMNSPLDFMKFLVQLTPTIGERLEMGPRVLAQEMAKAHGLRGLDVKMATRDVTQDFERGGTLTKAANQIIPFFNVNTQTLPWLARAAQQNPRGTALALAGMVMTPTLAVEAYNRADPERAKAYDDIPPYIKQQGLVIMAPNPQMGTDELGRPKYNYGIIPLRNFGMLAIPFRDAVAHAMEQIHGRDYHGEDVGEMLQSMVGSVSPIPVDSPSQSLSAFLPAIGGTLVQLAANHDFFRDKSISSEKANQSATSFSKWAAEPLGQVPWMHDIQPAQVEFAIRDSSNAVGGMLLAGFDLVARLKDQQPVGTYNPTFAESFPGAKVLTGNLLQSRGGYQDRKLQQIREGTFNAFKDDLIHSFHAGAGAQVGLPPDVRTTEDEKLARLAGELATLAVYGTKDDPQAALAKLQKQPGFVLLPPDQQASLLAQLRQAMNVAGEASRDQRMDIMRQNVAAQATALRGGR